MKYVLPLFVLAIIGATEAALTITGGSSLFLKAGAKISLTGLSSLNHVCWASGTSQVSPTCAPAGDASDAGNGGCSAALASTTLNVTWTTTTNTYITFLECAVTATGNNNVVSVGNMQGTVVTLVNNAGSVMFNTAPGIIARGTTINMTSAGSTNICYITNGTATPACAAEGNACTNGALVPTTGIPALTTNTILKAQACANTSEPGAPAHSAVATAVYKLVGVGSLKETTVQSLYVHTLHFETTGEEPTSMSYVKIINSSRTCESLAGTGDAITGGHGQLVYKDGNSATFILMTTEEAGTGFKICQRHEDDTGTFINLNQGEDTLDITAAPTVDSFVEVNIVSPTVLHFYVTNADADHMMYVKIVPFGISCAAGNGMDYAISGGAGQLTLQPNPPGFGTFTLTTSYIGTGLSVCQAYSSTGAYMSLSQSAATLNIAAGFTITGAYTGDNGMHFLSLQAGTNIELTGLLNSNHVCWSAGSDYSTAICAGAGNAADAGIPGCSAQLTSATTLSIPWLTSLRRYISFIQCTPNSEPRGSAKAVVLAEVGLKIKGGDTMLIPPGHEIVLTGLTDTNHVCWVANFTAGNSPTCALAGNTSDAGTTGCSAALSGATSLSIPWKTTSNKHISFIECRNSAFSTFSVNDAKATTVFQGCASDIDCPATDPYCSNVTAYKCMGVPTSSETCAAISHDRPVWDSNASTCISCTAHTSASSPVWSTVSNKCVAIASDDSTCAAISHSTPVWNTNASACVSCTANTSARTPVWSTVSRTCVALGSNDATCAAISHDKPKWDIVQSECGTCSDATSHNTPVWSTVTYTCVAAGSNDTTCAAISIDKPKWDSAVSECATCSSATSTYTPAWSIVTKSCVAAGSNDTTCAAINHKFPKWSTESSSCVAEGSDDATCAAIQSSFPVWSGSKCVECVNDSTCSGETPTCSNVTMNTCVAAGSDDASCAAISDSTSKWDNVSSVCVQCISDADCLHIGACSKVTSNICVPVGSSDATCQAIRNSHPKWNGSACVPTASLQRAHLTLIGTTRQFVRPSHYVIFIKTSSSGSLRGPNATIIVTPTTAIFKAGQLHRNVAVLYQSQCEATGTTGVSAIPALTISLTSANCLVSDNATFVVSSAYLIAPNLPAGSAMTATIKTSIDMVPSGRTDPILTTLCDPGKYNKPNFGCIDHTPCPAGRFLETPGTDSYDHFCTKCSAGQYSSGNDTMPTECKNCEAGKFVMCTGASKCEVCPVGQTTESEGSKSCTSVLATFVDRDPPAKFDMEVEHNNSHKFCLSWQPAAQEVIGETETTFVIVYITKGGSFTRETNESFVTCPVKKQCAFCASMPAPLYLESYSFKVGVQTASGRGLLSDPYPAWTVASECGQVQYLDMSLPEPNTWSCIPCPKGGDCKGLVIWKDIKPKFGYYRLGTVDADPDWFAECLNPMACLGGINYALEGRYFHEETGHAHNDMSLADDPEGCNSYMGYDKTCGASCTPRLCRACRKGYWPQGVSKCVPCPPPWLNLVVVVLGVIFLVFMLYTFLKTALDDASANATSPHHHFAQPLQKIILNHLQLISLASGFPLKWPDAIESMFQIQGVMGSAGDYMYNPACSEETAPGGGSLFFQKQMGLLLLPMVCFICSAVFWTLVAMKKCIQRCLKKGPPEKYGSFDKFVSTTVIMLYLLYPTLCKSTFSLVACKPVGKNQYLQMDLDTPCYQAEHFAWLFRLFFPSLFCYVLGLPIVSTLMLRCNKKHLGDARVKFRFGILFSGYKLNSYYWETVIATRKAAVVAVSVFLSNFGTELQALFALIVTVMYLILHVDQRPYTPISSKHDTLHDVEAGALMVAFFTMWSGLLFYQDSVVGTFQLVLTGCLILFNAVFMLYAVRLFLVLKLMDIDEEVQDGGKVSGIVLQMFKCMRMCVPHWLVRNKQKLSKAKSKLKNIRKLSAVMPSDHHAFGRGKEKDDSNFFF